jgi:hypothetical protein
MGQFNVEVDRSFTVVNATMIRMQSATRRSDEATSTATLRSLSKLMTNRGGTTREVRMAMHLFGPLILVRIRTDVTVVTATHGPIGIAVPRARKMASIVGTTTRHMIGQHIVIHRCHLHVVTSGQNSATHRAVAAMNGPWQGRYS